MFSSVAPSIVGYGSREVCKRVVTPQGARNMATLKDIKLRIKSVGSIAKLTKTMQMVASSKLRSATRKVGETKDAAASVNKIFEGKTITPLPVSTTDPTANPSLIVAVTSDKGMCGPVNNQIVRHAKSLLRAEREQKSDVSTLGSKGAPSLINEFPGQFAFSLKDFGKKDASFLETGFVVDQLLATRGYENVNVIYNKFKNALTYLVTEVHIPGPKTLLANKKQFARYEFDEDEDATFRDLFEFQLATTIWSGLMESRASELAARMTSMDSATKNATSIISLLAIQYNRGRQAAITTELIEITSGASALDEA